MISIVSLLLSQFSATLAVHWIFLRILKIAKVKGLVDNPNARKLQKTAVPVLGGIAVFFGMLFGLLMAVSLPLVLSAMGVEVVDSQKFTSIILPTLLGASVMLYVGSLDDILGLTPKSRLVIEVLVMIGLICGSGLCIDSLHGLWGVDSCATDCVCWCGYHQCL